MRMQLLRTPTCHDTNEQLSVFLQTWVLCQALYPNSGFPHLWALAEAAGSFLTFSMPAAQSDQLFTLLSPVCCSVSPRSSFTTSLSTKGLTSPPEAPGVSDHRPHTSDRRLQPCGQGKRPSQTCCCKFSRGRHASPLMPSRRWQWRTTSM